MKFFFFFFASCMMMMIMFIYIYRTTVLYLNSLFKSESQKHQASDVHMIYYFELNSFLLFFIIMNRHLKNMSVALEGPSMEDLFVCCLFLCHFIWLLVDATFFFCITQLAQVTSGQIKFNFE